MKFATEHLDSVTHVLHARAGSRSLRIQPAAIIGDRENQVAIALVDAHGRLGRVCVLDHVLQRLQDAEVHARLRFLRIAGERTTDHVDGDRRSAGLCLDGGDQPVLGEDRRIQTASELAKRFDGLIGIARQLIER